MYLVKRLFFLVCTIGMLCLIFLMGSKLLAWIDSAEPLATRNDTETRSLVHWLDAKQPLIYSFNNARVDELRVLSNAVLNSNAPAATLINYGIEYTLLDKDKRVLLTHRYHHASKLVDSDETSQVKQLIEDRKALSVASGQSFYINKATFKQTQSVSLTLIPETSAVKGVVVRVHAKVPTPENEYDRAWLQLPSARRDRILSYHTLGVNAVTPREIAHSVHYGWQKLAPQGVPKIDFQTDLLYEHLPYNVKTYDFDTEQQDLDAFYTDRQLNASIQIRESDFLTVTLLKNDVPIALTWYDETQLTPPKKVTLKHVGNNRWQTPHLLPGLLTIQSTQPQIARWHWSSGQLVDPKHSYYYVISPSREAHFSVTNNNDLRFEFRPLEPTDVTFILKKDGIELTRYSATLTPLISEFDRAIATSTERTVSPEPQAFYLRVREDADAIVVKSTSETWVKVQQRTKDALYQYVDCKTRCDALNEQQIGVWHSLNATNDFAFVTDDAKKSVRLFAKPASTDVHPRYYHAINLNNKGNRSNTALIYAPWKYFEPAPEPAPFRYRAIPNQENHENSLKTIAFTENTNLIITGATAPLVKRIDAKTEVALKPKTKKGSIYASMQQNSPWLEQRLYFLPAGHLVNLTLPVTAPKSVVIKVFSPTPEQTLHLKSFLHIEPKPGLNPEYTITRKHAILEALGKQLAFLIHPKTPTLFSYPSLTLAINNDVHQVNSLDLVASNDIWIAISFETAEEPHSVSWRQDAL
ncbi:hypothetical protein PALB_2140 [Pseudoalteromonas luteoviolacea B = ATCC 29581]|nr:hypothetical protein PALB_2140 [Pseudoalteromonas luteoviolacea B = ATCC 29581]